MLLSCNIEFDFSSQINTQIRVGKFIFYGSKVCICIYSFKHTSWYEMISCGSAAEESEKAMCDFELSDKILGVFGAKMDPRYWMADKHTEVFTKSVDSIIFTISKMSGKVLIRNI